MMLGSHGLVKNWLRFGAVYSLQSFAKTGVELKKLPVFGEFSVDFGGRQ